MNCHQQKEFMIAIVDYGTGNLFSLASALERCNAEYRITSSAEEILSASAVIMPGVGAAERQWKNSEREGWSKSSLKSGFLFLESA